MSQPYAVWLLKLREKVKKMVGRVEKNDPSNLQGDFDHCKSYLENLFKQSIDHEVDLAPHIPIIIEIQNDLAKVDSYLKKLPRTFWDFLMDAFEDMSRLISNFLGLAWDNGKLIGPPGNP
ncbi:MAG: hypothetical protein SF052_04520 [Bacteroidia bacterium]|nr:hypothetical protein [Bacteroidia bacterium]